MNKGSKIAGTILLVLIFTGGGIFFGFFWGNDFLLNDDPIQITPTLDGIINEDEWRRATYYNIPFYLDVDNSLDETENKRNVDGWNYFSVAEDDDYYYIGLDLCSDRTNNLLGEWISFFMLNRMPEIQYSDLGLIALEDFGYEYLFYNVSGDKPFEYYFSDVFFPANYYDIPIVPEYDTMELLRGDTSSTYLDFWRSNDGNEFVIQSENITGVTGWGDGEFIDLMFGINITEKFPDYNTSIFYSDLLDMDVNFRLKASLTSDSGHLSNASAMYCGVLDQGPKKPDILNATEFFVDDTYIYFDNDTYITSSVDLDHTKINATNGMYYFTLHCFNEENSSFAYDYSLTIDSLSLHLETTRISSFIGNSIGEGNYEIKWSYGASAMCAEDHRMFEFKIAKAEFPTLEEDMLYLFFAGYGTMSLIGTNFWAYPGTANSNPLYNPLDHQTDFLALDMSIT